MNNTMQSRYLRKNSRFVFPFVHMLMTQRRYAATLSHLVFYESYSDWRAWMTSNTEGRL